MENKTRAIYIYIFYKIPTSEWKTHRLKVTGWKKFYVNGNEKKLGQQYLYQAEYKKAIIRDKEIT